MLFASNKILSLVLNESEGLGLELAGADAPEVDGELAGHGHDGFLPRWAGRESAFA